MSNFQLQSATVGFIAAQLAVFLWVIIRRRGIRPVLIVNLLFAAGILWSVAGYVPGEVSFAWSDPDSDLFDYKNTIMAAFEGAVLLASPIVFWNVTVAKIAAWIGFAGNFALSLFAVWFSFFFEFKCCGYL